MYKPTAIDRTVGDARSERLPIILHSGTKRSRGQEAKPCENGPPENRCKRRHKWRGGWISHQRRNYLFEYESAIRTNLSINETSFRTVLGAYRAQQPLVHNIEQLLRLYSVETAVWTGLYRYGIIPDCNHTPRIYGKIGYPKLRRPACGGFSKVAHIVGEIRNLRRTRANSITGIE